MGLMLRCDCCRGRKPLETKRAGLTCTLAAAEVETDTRQDTVILMDITELVNSTDTTPSEPTTDITSTLADAPAIVTAETLVEVVTAQADASTPDTAMASGLPAPSPNGTGHAEANGKPAELPEPIEAIDDPHRLARLYLRQHCKHPDGLTLRYYRDQWWHWNGRNYRIVPDGENRARLTATAKADFDRRNVNDQLVDAHHDAQIAEATKNQKSTDGTPKRSTKKPTTAHKVTGRLISDVGHALQSLTLLNSTCEAPIWLGCDGKFPANEILACRNGLIHLPSLVAGKDFFLAPTPRFFSPSCIDFDFDPCAPPPEIWLNFLNQLWANDTESISTLQEAIGYLLTQDTRLQKIIMLIGPPRGGKGTIVRIVHAILGEANVVSPTLSDLAGRFGLWGLIGKSVATVSDVRLSNRVDAAAIVERLLSISGEDAQMIDRKSLPPIMAKLKTRFVLLSNELPKLADSSGALAGRMVLLRLTKSWLGREDSTLTERLHAELPGILLWAIDGWKRLMTRGYFVTPETSKGMAVELADLSSPVGAFVRDCCLISPAGRIEKSALYAQWKIWCEEQGRDHPGDAATFGRNLRAVVPKVGESYPHLGGRRVYFYTGIALNSV